MNNLLVDIATAGWIAALIFFGLWRFEVRNSKYEKAFSSSVIRAFRRQCQLHAADDCTSTGDAIPTDFLERKIRESFDFHEK